jgi:hypothetical protein
VSSIYTCSNCTWLARGHYTEYVNNGANSYMPGTCRINDPAASGFQVRSTDWCAQHSLLNSTPTPHAGGTDA